MEEQMVPPTSMARTEELPSLEEILRQQCEKLHQLEVATAFIKCKNTMKDDLSQIRKDVSTIASDIEGMKKKLNKMKQQNIRGHGLITLCKSLDKKIMHMTDNVPPKLIEDYRVSKEKQLSQFHYSMNAHDYSSTFNTPVNSAANYANHLALSARAGTQSGDFALKNCKKSLVYDPEVCPVMPLISEEEFSNLPKYMIGRQSLDALNSLVNTINHILKSKYGLLHMGKAGARKKGQFDLYLNYKKQEVSDDNGGDSGYMYFFTAKDYQNDTDTKLDKTKLNLLTCLRHCKRIREYRTGNFLRYVIITH